MFFVQKMSSRDFSPSLVINGAEIDDAQDIAKEYIEGLQRLLADILNPELPFAPTSSTATCLTCPLSQILSLIHI